MNKAAAITGAASCIGRAAARRLLEAGWVDGGAGAAFIPPGSNQSGSHLAGSSL